MKVVFLLGRKSGERAKLVEMGGDQNPGPEAPPRSMRENMRRNRKGDERGKATFRGAMKKVRSVGVIEGKVAGKDESIEYFLSAGSELPFKSHNDDGNQNFLEWKDLWRNKKNRKKPKKKRSRFCYPLKTSELGEHRR